MKYSKDTICPYPFNYISTTNSGTFRTCCESLGIGVSAEDYNADEVWNGDFYKGLRKDLINGIQHPNCARCWKNEQQGLISTRQKEVLSYDEDYLISLIDKTDEDGYLDYTPETFEFKIGNLCNLKCIMCTQMESSQHEAELVFFRQKQVDLPQTLNYIEEHVRDKDQIYRYQKSQQKKMLDRLLTIMPNLKLLKIVGGEPFINPLTNDILDLAIEHNHHKTISLEIISNLYQTDFKYIQKAKQFKNFRLLCSIDHIEQEKFNFIRFPCKYTEVENNFFKLLHDTEIDLEISATFNIFNIFDMKEILQQFEFWSKQREKELPVRINYVDEPRYFSFQYLSPELRQQVEILVERVVLEFESSKLFAENNQLYDYLKSTKNFIKHPPEDFKEVVEERSRVLKLYDNTRGTDYKSLFLHLNTL